MTEPRTALVTGANRGIGLEVVRQLLQHGMRVGLGSRSLEKGRRAVQESGLDQDRLELLELDVAHPDQGHFEGAVAQFIDRFGRLDVLVNNAAVDYDTHRAAMSANVTEVQSTFATNFFGAWRMAVAAIPFLKKDGGGCIVNVSSGGGSLTGMGGGTPAYSASKAALNVLTIKLSAELSQHRVICNAVCPGWVATDMGGGGRPIEEGASGVTWAATLTPDQGPTGMFFRDRAPIPW